MAFYDFKGSNDPTNGTTELILERDDQGNVTKSVESGGVPIELNKSDHDRLTGQGWVFEEVSKSEADKRAAQAEETVPVDPNVVQAPSFGDDPDAFRPSNS